MLPLSLLDHIRRHKIQSKLLALDKIDWPRNMRLLALAPHPDDFDAIAVAMRFFYSHGHDIALAVLGGGASGVEDDFAGTADARRKAAVREEEQRDSCRAFGIAETAMEFLRLMEDADGEPRDDTANAAALQSVIMRRQPDVVFLPHGNDSNAGHQRAFGMIGKVLARQAAPAALMLNRDPKTIKMRMEIYMPFDVTAAQWKAGLLRRHASQQHRNMKLRGTGFDARILAANRRFAEECGCDGEFAEVFEFRPPRIARG